MQISRPWPRPMSLLAAAEFLGERNSELPTAPQEDQPVLAIERTARRRSWCRETSWCAKSVRMPALITRSIARTRSVH